ncbi:MAG: penicillin-binding protein activator [Thiomonas sp.]|nr:penicillin-binding protein activator [Thiomonas sp.]
MARNKNATSHIALLLPLQSGVFGEAARTVQQGFMAAASLEPYGLPVRVYSNYDENNSVANVYREALANGALAVVGPLTRNGVKMLAEVQNFPVPTLSLNVPEIPPAHNLYYFGMAIDAEARQVAQLARQQGHQQAIVITSNESLSRRQQLAFEEQWTFSGGIIVREIDFHGDKSVFSDIVAKPGLMVFFATDVEKSREIHPFLPKELAAYATSQIFLGNDQALINYDLDGIHFVDMPWLLHADQPAMMAYPRAELPLTANNDRLYALGLDAYRLTQLLLTHQEAALPLEGATGRIRLNHSLFQREALPATFVQGRAQTSDAPAAPTVQMFPGQVVNPGTAASDVPETTDVPTLQ